LCTYLEWLSARLSQTKASILKLTSWVHTPPTTHTCSMSKQWVFFHHKSKAVFLTKQVRYLLSILPEYGLPGNGKLLHETQSSSPCAVNLLEHEPSPTLVVWRAKTLFACAWKVVSHRVGDGAYRAGIQRKSNILALKVKKGVDREVKRVSIPVTHVTTLLKAAVCLRCEKQSTRKLLRQQPVPQHVQTSPCARIQ
jgi:hypothetical protein